jgi:solute carrier family 25 carnitine/acylcarnitine transporter 20/29
MGTICSFWSYELCKRNLSSLDESGQQEALKVLFCGGIAGIITWASVFPLDVVKTRLQAQPLIAHTVTEATEAQQRPLLTTSPSRPRTLNSLEIARDAYRSEGFAVFFRGLGICSVRAFIVNAAQVSCNLPSCILRLLIRSSGLYMNG